MSSNLSFSQFAKQFHNNTTCLEEIRRRKYPKGIVCSSCRRITSHYRIKNRPAYGCIVCRRHTYPLSDTIFEKSSTPLRLWFFALFLMANARGDISALQLKSELGVTYKTAWRMKKLIKKHMLYGLDELYPTEDAQISKVHKWVFFKHFEIEVVEKEE